MEIPHRKKFRKSLRYLSAAVNCLRGKKYLTVTGRRTICLFL